MDSFAQFFTKWFMGPGYDANYPYREVASSTPEGIFRRNNFLDHVDALVYVKERLFRENLYLSIAWYPRPVVSEPLFKYLFYDFDYEKDPELAVRKALEFSKSIRERFGADTILVKSGFKGMHVIIPLKKPVNGFETYSYLWNLLIAPYDYGSVVDRRVCEPRRLERIPYTYNIKVINGRIYRRYVRIVDKSLRPLEPRDFDWQLYEPLDNTRIRIVKVVSREPNIYEIVIRPRRKHSKQLSKLPTNIEELARSDAIPPCIKNIVEALIKAGDIDHHARLALVWYLKWIGFRIDQVVEFFRRYARDYNERITRYQVEYAYGLRGSRRDWIMYSCRRMRELGLCLECGWNRNPVTYTYVRAQVPEEIKQRFFSQIQGEVATRA